jgi:hypothetical protein
MRCMQLIFKVLISKILMPNSYIYIYIYIYIYTPRIFVDSISADFAGNISVACLGHDYDAKLLWSNAARACTVHPL